MNCSLFVQIAWYLGDTTDSLSMLASGEVDFALTYNAAAEAQSVNSGIASDRVYAFRVCGTIIDVFPVKL
jgi:spermidine/putrescine-binding protein